MYGESDGSKMGRDNSKMRPYSNVVALGPLTGEYLLDTYVRRHLGIEQFIPDRVLDGVENLLGDARAQQ